MVGDGFENRSIQVKMAWRRRHPHGGHVFSDFVVVTAFAPAPSRSLGGSPGADADCRQHRRHLEDDGSCVVFVVRGW